MWFTGSEGIGLLALQPNLTMAVWPLIVMQDLNYSKRAAGMVNYFFRLLISTVPDGMAVAVKAVGL